MSGLELSSPVADESYPTITYYLKRTSWGVVFLQCYALLSAFNSVVCTNSAQWLHRWSSALNFQYKYGSLTRTVNCTQLVKLALPDAYGTPSRFIPIAENESFIDLLDALYKPLEFSLYGETNATV